MRSTSKMARTLPRNSDALRDLVAVVRPSCIVEFGSWQGRSALTFLLEARKLGLDSKIICVDTWLGSAEHWQNSFPGGEWSFDELRVRNGEPQILKTFWRAIRDHDMVDKTSIVRAPTSFATPYLRQAGVKPDLVYVDADHSYQAVLEDLSLADSLVSQEGVIAGDDYSWQSVRLALGRYKRMGHTVLVSNDRSQFVILRSTQIQLITSFQHHGWRIESFILCKEILPLFRSKVLDRLYLAARIPELKLRFSRNQVGS